MQGICGLYRGVMPTLVGAIPYEVTFLKSQLTTKCTQLNDFKSNCWEFLKNTVYVLYKMTVDLTKWISQKSL